MEIIMHNIGFQNINVLTFFSINMKYIMYIYNNTTFI